MYLLALLLGTGLRFLLLNQAPLSDSEATLALQALQTLHGNGTLISSQPGYILLTGLSFFMFESSNFLARFLPAAAGSLFILAPILFRKQIGQRAAVILAFALAFDPALVAASRQADGLILGVSFLILGLGFLLNQKISWAGIFLGLAVISGPNLWLGVFTLLIAYVLHGFSQPEISLREKISADLGQMNWRELLAWFAGSIFVFGTMFFTAPQGLSAVVQAFLDFLKGWMTSSNIRLGNFLIALLAYELFPLIFGLIKTFSGKALRTEADRFFVRWLILALLIILIYPGHQALDLIWVILPLWVLAARQLSVSFESVSEDDRIPGIGLAVLAIVLLVFIFLNLVGVARPLDNLTDTQARLVSGIGAAAVLVLVALLLAWGWSKKSSVYGLQVGITFMLIFTTLASAWDAAGLGTHPEAEIWRKDAYIQSENLLLQTIQAASEWSTGRKDAVDIVAININSPALDWAMRDYKGYQVESFLPADASPAVVITQKEDSPYLVEAYGGQDFVWHEEPSWALMFNREWLYWAIFKESPLEQDQLIVWVRSDLFPAAQ